ncbi:uncharacterized protein LOC119139191 [Syngnathus acus]|uniref:uncharacterized protein LOC119139191 n=1 Tax=Syngnathus acus TaxID=161584 RepID=UPI00188627BC|nr:uncharacterized protein LOC119139191 [Syngnathus acus]
MDASPPLLRAQREDEFRANLRRLKNENNKMSLEPHNSKAVPTANLPKKDSENQDPERNTLVRPKVSRLPVLIKSLQPPSAFHDAQWEEKILSGKAKKKKSCTRPKPFNVSRQKSLKTDIVTLEPKNGARATHLKNNVCVKTQKTKENPLKSPAVLKSTVAARKEKCMFPEKASGHSDTLKCDNAANQKTSSFSSACLDNMSHLSLKDPVKDENVQNSLSSHPHGKAEGFQPNHAALLSILRNEGVCVSRPPFATSSSHAMFPQRASVVKSHQKAAASQNKGVKATGSVRATPQNVPGKGTYLDTPQRVLIKKNLVLADRAAEFQPDSSSLQSILRNEGVCISTQLVATPRSQSYAVFPRVSTTKNHQNPAASHKVKTAGPVRATPTNPSTRGTIDTPQRVPIKENLAAAEKAVEFKPDSTSLQSILRNEGVCISSQSIGTPRSQSYSMFPQRVSIFKSHQKSAGSQNKGLQDPGPVRATPQNPLGRSTFINTSQRVPIKKSLAAAVSTHKEAKSTWTSQRVSPPSPAMEVAQVLFFNQEDRHSPDKGKKEQLPVLQVSPMKTHCEDKIKNAGDEEVQKPVEGQQFNPTLQRESVIFFSASKKHSEQKNLARQELRGQDPSEKGQVRHPACRTKLASHFMHKDQKTGVTNTALAILPKHFAHMEELRLDKEVAFYISRSISDSPRFFPSEPRTSNPVATLLHLQESSKFVPLSLDAVSPCSTLR